MCINQARNKSYGLIGPKSSSFLSITDAIIISMVDRVTQNPGPATQALQSRSRSSCDAPSKTKTQHNRSFEMHNQVATQTGLLKEMQ